MTYISTDKFKEKGLYTQYIQSTLCLACPCIYRYNGLSFGQRNFSCSVIKRPRVDTVAPKLI